MSAARDLIERLHGLGVDLSVDGDRLRFVATVDPIKSDTLSELKRHKAAVLSLLKSIPSYSRDQCFDLSAWCAAQDRATRLRIMRRKNALRVEDGIPEPVALCMAIESERDDFNPRVRYRPPANPANRVGPWKIQNGKTPPSVKSYKNVSAYR